MSSRPSSNSRPLPSFSLRLFVVLMALLQFVAPTWHICALGGHAMSMSAGGSMASHTGMTAIQEAIAQAKARSEASPGGTQQAVICYCPARPRQLVHVAPNTPKLTSTPSHGDHATCLALLLQTMPGAVAAPATLFQLQAPVVFHWEATYETSPSIAFLGRFRGRAPPVNC